MTARLAHVAAQAGVSEATVSRVLNDRPGVSEATRQAVLTALDVLGYDRPSRLRESAAGLVGLIVPELSNPVFPTFAQVIETGLVVSGYMPLLCTQTPGGIQEDDYLRMLLDRGVAGVVFVSGLHADTTSDASRYVALHERRLPIVLVNGFVEGLDVPCLSNDDAAAMDLAVSHLAGLGHRRIGLATGPERFRPVQRRTAAFEPAVRRHLGEGAEAHVEHTIFSVEGGVAAAHRLLDRGVTAIACGSDLMALGAIRAVRDRGLRVPEDVSVVGSDDSSLMAFTDPPLTTIRQSVQAIGDAAVRALVDEILGHPTPRGEFLFRPELIVRSSTAVAAS
ncbi:LacI family DNA-binding transcriptional regulator [Kineococcus xinjiangensis]|uniref:LacI family DNA-binding transcriptional regulator n=1 Tax=Kineococcus xinjiangensis TaxID=512762 RepID=UPI000CEC9203|nr:LacI family DNA-binding transcriptional regulator [Kineococcus xinjiangensis]